MCNKIANTTNELSEQSYQAKLADCIVLRTYSFDPLYDKCRMLFCSRPGTLVNALRTTGDGVKWRMRPPNVLSGGMAFIASETE